MMFKHHSRALLYYLKIILLYLVKPRYINSFAIVPSLPGTGVLYITIIHLFVIRFTKTMLCHHEKHNKQLFGVLKHVNN